MSTQANLLHDTTEQTATVSSARISPVRLLLWSVRRELWDNHSLYLAPAIVAGLVLLGFFFGPFGIGNSTHAGLGNGESYRLTVITPYDLASALLLMTSVLLSVFYSLDALYAERRDRSLLFWKSLPVSDLTAVLAKTSIPLLVVPLITFATVVVTHLSMALASSVVLLRMGEPVAPLWVQLNFAHTWVWLLGHLLVVAALWYAPFYTWMLLVSAWATRAPLLLAFLPPLALAALEAMVWRTAHIGTALVARLAHGNMTVSRPEPVLSGCNTPEMWLGLLTAAVFFAATVQLRRYRGAL